MHIHTKKHACKAIKIFQCFIFSRLTNKYRHKSKKQLGVIMNTTKKLTTRFSNEFEIDTLGLEFKGRGINMFQLLKSLKHTHTAIHIRGIGL